MKLRLIFICFLLFNCQSKDTLEEDKNDIINTTTTPIKVNIQTIKERPFNKQIISNGKIEALQKSELRFKIGNRIAKINVRNGAYVNKGAIIAYLDNELLANSVQKAQIDLDKAKSKFSEEKINYGLYNKEESNIDPVVLKNLQFKSGLQEAQNTLENIQILYNQTILKAPFSGVIANIETKTGNYTTANDVFCTIIDQSILEINFSVLETEFMALSENQSVSIIPFSNTNNIYKGTIEEINPLVDKNGLIKIKARITTEDTNLFDGINVKVIINSPIENVIVIPKKAIVLRSNKEVVFTVKNNIAKWNYVEIVAENSTHYAIKKGVIKINDSIIVSGNLNISHDTYVQSTLVEEN